MSQRRLFSPDIVKSDAFLDMPVSSRDLYFYLAMDADDDGFVNPKRIIRSIGASDDDLKVLVAKRFVLPFETGVVVIKHWLIHNSIRKDRYHKTKYIEEKNTLFIKDNMAYTEVKPLLATIRQPVGNHSVSEVKLSKVKLSKVNLIKDAPLKSDIEELLEDKGGIQYDYQFVGLEVFEKTGAPASKKAECIRLAKKYPNLINPSLSFCLDYPNPAVKWKMFLWKLNKLVKENA